jgi:hypothetical protein
MIILSTILKIKQHDTNSLRLSIMEQIHAILRIARVSASPYRIVSLNSIAFQTTIKTILPDSPRVYFWNSTCKVIPQRKREVHTLLAFPFYTHIIQDTLLKFLPQIRYNLFISYFPSINPPVRFEFLSNRRILALSNIYARQSIVIVFKPERDL